MMIVCHMMIIQVQIFPRRPSGVCPPIDNTDGSRVCCATCYNILWSTLPTSSPSSFVDRFHSGGKEMKIVFCTAAQQMTLPPSLVVRPSLPGWSNEGGWCISKPPPSSWPGHLWWAIASHKSCSAREMKMKRRPMMSAKLSSWSFSETFQIYTVKIYSKSMLLQFISSDRSSYSDSELL